mgnify:CR=1 FL=1
MSKFKITTTDKVTGESFSGNEIENKEFKQPDDNGSTDLIQAWTNECKKLDKEYNFSN